MSTSSCGAEKRPAPNVGILRPAWKYTILDRLDLDAEQAESTAEADGEQPG